MAGPASKAGDGVGGKGRKGAARSANVKAALAVWGSREESQPGNAIQLRTSVNELIPQLVEAARDGGRHAHHVGTKLAIFFHARADELYGKSDFLTFVKEVLGLSRAQAYRYARIARYATLEQSTWGTDAVLQLAAIIELLAARPSVRKRLGLTPSPATISDLLGVDLPLRGKKTLKLSKETATVPALEEVFECLGGNKATAGSTALNANDRWLNDRLQAALSSEPDLEGVEARLSKGRAGVRLLLKVPTGANLERVAKAVGRAFAGAP